MADIPNPDDGADRAGEVARLARSIRAELELSVDGFAALAPRRKVLRPAPGRPASAAPAAAKAAPASAPSSVPTSAAALAIEPGHAVLAARSMSTIREDLGDCQRCKLAGTRTKIVFGVGNPAAQLVFVGEGPGRDEDLEGEPFVGLAGQLLTRIIENVFHMKRHDVYITNVVKCRPPQNRNPEPDELAACEPFLIRQLGAIAPRVIVALGKFAAQTLLRTDGSISRLRGRFHDYHGIALMPTYHPAYLLRTPEMKRVVFEDMKLVVAKLAESASPP